ncbi:MAG: hypothetical protein JHC31_16140, partial [Sulfurihydrogenibium sp.]|nr:hypothetical protein [Sulfurihydrogenibium sp.]
MEEIINHYAKKFNIMPIQMSEKEREVLKKFSNIFSTQDLLKAIDQLDRRPFNADALSRQLMTILSNLNAKPKKKEEVEEKEEKKAEERLEEKSEKNAEEKNQKRKPQRLTFNNIPDNYKEIFTKYNIPIDIIDFNTLSSLDKYMKSFYLSDMIAEYLYTNLPQEKLSQYNKIANEHFSKMKLSEREKPEAYKIYIKMLIKKELGIYV